MLTGQEAKSCRMGHVNLAGAYVSFAGGTPALRHAKISPYPFAGPLPEYDPGQDRRLLMKIPEMKRLETMIAEKGMTIVPLEVRAGKYIKVLIGVGRGRKTIDKRARIKEREMGKKMRRGEEI